MDGLKTFEITRSIVEENCLGLQNPFVLEITLKIYVYCKQPHRLDIFSGHHVLIYLRDEYFFFSPSMSLSCVLFHLTQIRLMFGWDC